MNFNTNTISEKKSKIECKVKYKGGCRNAVSDNLQIFDGLVNEYSMETCYELCSKESTCDGFLLGLIDFTKKITILTT